MPKGYDTRHLKDVPPTPCPCGQSWRLITRRDGSPANIHVTSIQDSRRHFHRHCTEFYFILEGEGTLEVGDDSLALTPGLLVRIDPGTPHRGHGHFKTLVIGVPAWDPADEWFTDD
ncbi:MAG TPA: cupin domain-containing protein [Planctomycetota bacterium]|nr:cupin domain-containing protein [Planctomycetota bacterium]HRR82530.1 cupin domain-containing protein [Planctomycetota bacterium]HRT97560.1 cupin domain-containing protein [Planctomycetota bacterium]